MLYSSLVVHLNLLFFYFEFICIAKYITVVIFAVKATGSLLIRLVVVHFSYFYVFV